MSILAAYIQSLGRWCLRLARRMQRASMSLGFRATNLLPVGMDVEAPEIIATPVVAAFGRKRKQARYMLHTCSAAIASVLFAFVLSPECIAADSSSLAPLPEAQKAQADSTSSEILPVTTRETASERARLGAGRVDPFSPFTTGKEFPAGSPFATLKVKKATTTGTQSREKHGLIPPPPPTVLASPPPPPPVETKSTLQLPEPPARPRLSDSMKLVGIIGQQALFVFTDKQLRRANKWPRTLALSPGEQFESVNLLSTDDHLATLEEDGVRTVKELPIIR